MWQLYDIELRVNPDKLRIYWNFKVYIKHLKFLPKYYGPGSLFRINIGKYRKMNATINLKSCYS